MRSTTWYTCKVFGILNAKRGASIISGALVLLEGDLQLGAYSDKEGKPRVDAVVMVHNLKIVIPAKGTAKEAPVALAPEAAPEPEMPVHLEELGSDMEDAWLSNFAETQQVKVVA